MLFLSMGLGLLAWVLLRVDLSAALDHVGRLGWGVPAVFVTYYLAFLADTWSWQLLLDRARSGNGWFHRLWKVRMVGAALNRITPFIGMGGEPVKAMLLKRHYGFAYPEAVSSLVAAKTVNLIALVAFFGMGLLAALDADWLDETFRNAAVAGFATLALGIGLVFGLQVGQVASRLSAAISGQRWGHWLRGVIDSIRAMDRRLLETYSRDKCRFLTAMLATLANWLLGAVELWLILYFLGRPIGLVDALCVDAAVELVRAGTFFIPASLGAQEGAIVVLLSALTGEPALGLAVALIRRFREVVWVVWGSLIAWAGFRRPALSEGPGHLT